MIKIILLAVSVIFSSRLLANAGLIDYPDVDPAPSYTSLLELDYSQSTKTIDYGSDPQQFVQFYKAKKAEESQTMVIFVHGGCWLSEYDIQHSSAFATALSQKGMDVWNIEYRRAGNGGEWPVALNDIKAAINMFTTEFNKEGKYKKVFLLGHSAGGHLAMRVASELNLPNLHLIGLAPIVDVQAYAFGDNSCQTATKAFMQGMPNDIPEAYDNATLVNKSLSHLPSAYIFHGGEDKIVPIAQTIHPDTGFMQIPYAAHFDWIFPGTPGNNRLLQYMEKIVNE
ncbi:alpha/beta hydrolase [Glaciecola sp. 1036]|uniref:alpha/beta hydrolase n=1 Tax=Alteromonadaceae TaxID=72275 RepID=UPI003D091AF5